jgi:protein involved in polysaccharide export with SLBB domain
MFKKIIFSIVILSTYILAEPTQAQAMTMIKSNPALLNTPQAKAEMAKRGIDKSQVLQKVNSIPSEENNTLIEVENDIADNVQLLESKEDIVEEEKYILYANPLAYKGNAEKLKDIKSKQNEISTKSLKRFSKTFFTNKNTLNSSSLPVPSYYIINKNDTISIWIYGGVNKNIEAIVDNNGNINIDTLGPIKVAGLEFKKVNEILKAQLSSAFAGAEVALNISSYSTIQITLTGDVNGAGVYNIASLSTIKDLLIISGGVKENGSVRDIIIKRDGKILKNIDFYELLLGENEGVSTLLRSGDIVFVPKAQKIVAIDGGVVNPALYELRDNENLDSLIKYAGELKANASKSGIKVQGFNDNEKLVVDNINFNDAKNKKLQNSDKVYVYSIDAVHKESIYLYGNVVRPGNRNVEKSLSALLKKEISSLGLKGVFLENTLFTYAMIKSKNEDLTTSVSRFNLSEVISGNSDVKLNIDDEIYIFNKLDSELNPYVTIKGSVVAQSGEFQYYTGLTVSDLIQIAGLKAPYDTSKIKVVTYNTKDLMPFTKIIDLKDASNYLLSAYDEVELYDYYDLNQISIATISGQVNLPKDYNINSNMTLNELIITAGGLTQKAYKSSCEIIRYHIVNDERVKEIINIPLSKANKFKIKNFDEITIKTIPNWSERKSVTLKGEVKFPGTYVIEYGDKLADVIKRAAGFTNEAFLYGAVFSRESVKELQKKRLRESLVKLKQKAAAMGSVPKAVGQSDGKTMSDTANTIDSLSKEAEALQPIGRVTIELKNDIELFSKSSSNLSLKDKDELIIPSFNDTVLVMGQVMNPTAIIYDDDDDVATYLSKAGGLTQLADDDNIYVIHANGEAQKYSAGIFLSDSVNVKTGDVIVVPQELVTTTGMQFAKDISGILYQFAVTAAALTTVGAL